MASKRQVYSDGGNPTLALQRCLSAPVAIADLYTHHSVHYSVVQSLALCTPRLLQWTSSLWKVLCRASYLEIEKAF